MENYRELDIRVQFSFFEFSFIFLADGRVYICEYLQFYIVYNLYVVHKWAVVNIFSCEPCIFFRQLNMKKCTLKTLVDENNPPSAPSHLTTFAFDAWPLTSAPFEGSSLRVWNYSRLTTSVILFVLIYNIINILN